MVAQVALAALLPRRRAEQEALVRRPTVQQVAMVALVDQRHRPAVMERLIRIIWPARAVVAGLEFPLVTWLIHSAAVVEIVQWYLLAVGFQSHQAAASHFNHRQYRTPLDS